MLFTKMMPLITAYAI